MKPYVLSFWESRCRCGCLLYSRQYVIPVSGVYLQEMLCARVAVPLLALAALPSAVLAVVLVSLSPSATGQKQTGDDASPGLR